MTSRKKLGVSYVLMVLLTLVIVIPIIWLGFISMGAGRVALAGHHRARIEAAARLGADLAFDTRERPLTQTVRELMPDGVDLYIDAVGNADLLMDGMRIVREQGTIGLYGLGLRADAAIDWSLLPHNCILQTVQWPIATQESAVHVNEESES